MRSMIVAKSARSGARSVHSSIASSVYALGMPLPKLSINDTTRPCGSIRSTRPATSPHAARSPGPAVRSGHPDGVLIRARTVARTTSLTLAHRADTAARSGDDEPVRMRLAFDLDLDLGHQRAQRLRHADPRRPILPAPLPGSQNQFRRRELEH